MSQGPEDSSRVLERLRGLLPEVAPTLRYALSLPKPVDPVVRSYLRSHLGFWDLEVASALEIGVRRQGQEDGLVVDPARRAFVVLDGMGGQRTGDWAIQVLQRSFQDFPPIPHSHAPILQREQCPLFQAFHQGHLLVETFNQQHRASVGATAAGILVHGEDVHIAHIGDCRVYLRRAGQLHRCTVDHTLIEEYHRIRIAREQGLEEGEPLPMELSEDQQHYHNIIMRSLGFSPAEVAWSRRRLLQGDVLLLCSDGIWKELPPEVLEQMMLQPMPSLQHRADSLVQAVMQRGAPDNLSLILVEVPGD